jgi:hypothetical protein
LRFTKTESEILDILIDDCRRLDFSEKQALAYIEARFKAINRDIYYPRKKKLGSKPEAEGALKYHNDIGFVIDHIDMVKGIKATLKGLHQDFFYAVQRDIKDKDLYAEAALAKEINSLTLTLRQLNVDLPYIWRMKEELDRAKAITSGIIKIQGPMVEETITIPESAMTIPQDSIAGKTPDKQEQSDGDVDRPVV